jgi:hypothetical protein
MARSDNRQTSFVTGETFPSLIVRDAEIATFDFSSSVSLGLFEYMKDFGILIKKIFASTKWE